jgi:hypothetical protein
MLAGPAAQPSLLSDMDRSRTLGTIRRARPLAIVAACVAAVGSCGGRSGNDANDPSHVEVAAADLPELEIRSSGLDRFTVCPPPGDLGQHWIPPLPPWKPPSMSADAGPIAVDQELLLRTADRTLTELAVEATHKDFRSCYRRGLVRRPTQDGRVAIVLRIGPDGRVAKVESYSACELAVESIACMYGVAQKLRFPPPEGGSETVTIPVAFTSRDGVRKTVPTANDSYTAAAYVTLETARPALHTCEEQARHDGRPIESTGTYTLDIAADGRVAKVRLDPWSGDEKLVTCAARALEQVRFTAPAGGKATVIARLNFNPRQAVR